MLVYPPDSAAAYDTVRHIRAMTHDLPGADAHVGGSTALAADKARAQAHDRKVVMPLVLAVVFIVLVLLLRALAEHRTTTWPAEYFVCYAPEELVRPLLGTFHPKFHTAALLRGFVARYELVALPTIRDRMPAEQTRLLQPFTGPEIASSWPTAWTSRPPARHNAQTWFGRHAEDAVRDLTPAAVGQAGVRRNASEKALVWIQAAGSSHHSPGGIPLSVLDRVVASETLRDLTEVMED